MSFKTTFYLAMVLLALGAFYFITQARLGAVEKSVEETSSYGQSPVSRDFLKDKLGDVVKIVCKTKKDDTWVFEKDTADAADATGDWRMTSPLDVGVMSWEVQRFASQFNGLMYDISYKPGESGGVTAVDAGLDPPEATVTLTDTDGKTASIEIGKASSTTSTYVRLVGSDEICVGNASLENLIKSKALDYRDRQAWRFEPSDATRIEIVDRSDADKPVTYILARHDANWMMESPVTAKATSKIDQLVSTLSSLRVTSWQDGREDRLSMYGLQPAVLTVRVTVEEEVEVEEEAQPDAAAKESEDAGESDAAEEGDSKTKTRTEIKTYVLHLSDRSPIGEETKVYLRLGDETVTGMLMKSTADRFKPAMTEWREMGITSVDVRSATRVELTTAQGKATLVKLGARWTFAEDESRAEESAVTELLGAVAKLTAVVFVEYEDGEPSSFGLDQPQAEVRLSVPGVENVERIMVGGYTDAKIKRMVYVRRNEARSIGKVRVADVEALLRAPRAYRDRTVIDLVSTRVEQIVLVTENRFGTERVDATFSRGPDEWTMVAPIAAAIQQERIDQLVRAVADLRASEIVADEAELTAYGLHAPDATIAITHKPPIEYKIEKSIDSDPEAKDEPGDESNDKSNDKPNDKPKNVEPVEVQPPDETITLAFTKHDGKIYAKRSDRPAIYELGLGLYDRLFEEYRTDEVLAFDEGEVVRFSIRRGQDTHVFEKRDGRWLYSSEPDLPLDPKKVEHLLLQIKDLQTKRYVAHDAKSMVDFDLSPAFHEVSVSMGDGTKRTLSVSKRICEQDPGKGNYATVEGTTAVFLLTPDAVDRFAVVLDELEAN